MCENPCWMVLEHHGTYIRVVPWNCVPPRAFCNFVTRPFFIFFSFVSVHGTLQRSLYTYGSSRCENDQEPERSLFCVTPFILERGRRAKLLSLDDDLKAHVNIRRPPQLNGKSTVARCVVLVCCSLEVLIWLKLPKRYVVSCFWRTVSAVHGRWCIARYSSARWTVRSYLPVFRLYGKHTRTLTRYTSCML